MMEREYKAGEKIDGSYYYRQFCRRCKTPMRVTYIHRILGTYCEECSPGSPPPPMSGITQRQMDRWQEMQSDVE